MFVIKLYPALDVLHEQLVSLAFKTFSQQSLGKSCSFLCGVLPRTACLFGDFLMTYLQTVLTTSSGSFKSLAASLVF